MALEDLKLEPGTWVVSNCAVMPSESNCQLVIMGPQDQQDDLVDAAVSHAVDKHGHEDDEALRSEVVSQLQTMEVA